MIVERRFDITQQYDHWFNIALGLARLMGEEGRQLFHDVSQFHCTYDKHNCDLCYNNALKSERRGEKETSYKTFLYYAKEAGIDPQSDITDIPSYDIIDDKYDKLQNIPVFDGLLTDVGMSETSETEVTEVVSATGETAEPELTDEAEDVEPVAADAEEVESGCMRSDAGGSNSLGYSFSDKIVHDDWPAILWKYLDCMDNPQDRDKIILAIIVMASGIIGGASYVDGKRAGVYGIYGNRIVYANLYLALFGPPATNKGELADIGHIVDSIQNVMNKEYEQ